MNAETQRWDFENDKGYKITLETFREELDDSIKQFDSSTDSSYSFFGRLFAMEKAYSQPYSQKAKRYNEHITLAAILHNDTKDLVIGVINIGIKDCVLKDTQVKAGCIFEWKLHNNFLTIGLGGALFSKAEEIAKSMQVKLLYCLTATTHTNTIAFYQSQGFTKGTEEFSSLLLNVPKTNGKKKISQDDVVFKKLDTDTTRKAFSDLSKEHEFHCKNLEEYTKVDEYFGTYQLETKDGKCRAGISIYEDSGPFRHLTRFLFPVNYYASSLFCAILMGLLSLIPAAVFTKSAVAGIGLELGLLLVFRKIIEIVKVLGYPNQQAFATGVFYEGDPSQEASVMNSLTTMLSSTIHELGKRRLRVLFNKDSKFKKYFRDKYPGSYSILYKPLSEDLSKDSDFSALASPLFDFRDV